jgi:hypothetical protein
VEAHVHYSAIRPPEQTDWPYTQNPFFPEPAVGATDDIGNTQYCSLKRTFQSLIDDGEAADNAVMRFEGLHGSAILESNAGHVRAAVNAYQRCLSCARVFLEPLPILILLGDALFVAQHARDTDTLTELAGLTEQYAVRSPRYLACADMLLRSAALCNEAHCRSVVDTCEEIRRKCLAPSA